MEMRCTVWQGFEVVGILFTDLYVLSSIDWLDVDGTDVM